MGLVAISTLTTNQSNVNASDLNGLATPIQTEFNGNIENVNIKSSAAIAISKIALTGAILNTHVNASAAIDGSKISPDFGAQNIVTTGNIDLGGDIDVDGTLETDAITLNGAAVNSANGLLKLDTSGKVASSQMPSTAVKLKVGSYAGNSSGSNRSITGVGFQPLFILIYKAGASYGDFVKGTGDSGSKHIGSNNYYTTDGIVSLDSDGFTIKDASGNNVNESGYTYYYMAIG